jgi:hypothetical protein
MRVLNKLRAYRKEYKFARDVTKRFYSLFRQWRSEHPDDNIVYIYVGAPEMAETMIRRSPLWQKFEHFQMQEAVRTGNFSAFEDGQKYDA